MSKRNPMAYFLQLAQYRRRVVGDNKKHNKKKKGRKMQSQNLGKMRVTRKSQDKNKHKSYKNDRRLQRQLKQTNQLKSWSK